MSVAGVPFSPFTSSSFWGFNMSTLKTVMSKPCEIKEPCNSWTQPVWSVTSSVRLLGQEFFKLVKEKIVFLCVFTSSQGIFAIEVPIINLKAVLSLNSALKRKKTTQRRCNLLEVSSMSERGWETRKTKKKKKPQKTEKSYYVSFLMMYCRQT